MVTGRSSEIEVQVTSSRGESRDNSGSGDQANNGRGHAEGEAGGAAGTLVAAKLMLCRFAGSRLDSCTGGAVNWSIWPQILFFTLPGGYTTVTDDN